MQSTPIIEIIQRNIATASHTLARIHDYSAMSKNAQESAKVKDDLKDRDAYQLLDVMCQLLSHLPLNQDEKQQVQAFLGVQLNEVLNDKTGGRVKARIRLRSAKLDLANPSSDSLAEADSIRGLLACIEKNCEMLRTLVIVNRNTKVHSVVNFTIYEFRLKQLLEILTSLKMMTAERIMVHDALMHLARQYSNVINPRSRDQLERYPLEMQLETTATAHFSSRTL